MWRSQVVGPRRVIEALRQMPPEHVVEPGVTAADALTVMTAGEVPDGVRFVPRQVYGVVADRHLHLQLFARMDPAERRPGVVLIHGGGFVEGFPEMLSRYAAQLAGTGYVTAAIEYRLAGEALYPAPVEDAKCAVRWLRSNAAMLGLDPHRIAAAGNSAGGYLAAMVGGTPGDLEGTGGHGDTSSAVQAVVMWYPPTDLRQSVTSEGVTGAVLSLFGRPPGEEEAYVASPIAHVSRMPPTLSMSGTDDPLVPIRGLREYHAALDGAGVPQRLVEFDGVGHSFDYNLLRWQACFDEITTWLATHLGD